MTLGGLLLHAPQGKSSHLVRVSLNNKIYMDNQNLEGQAPTKVTKTWFIQRGQDPKDVFACDEQDAWGLFHNRTNWMRKDFRIVGVSDGKTYVRVLKENSNLKAELETKVAKLSSDIGRYNRTLDKLKFEDLLTEKDEKVSRVTSIVAESQKDLDVANNELANIQKLVVERAFNAELDVARGKIEHPTNHDVFTPTGNRAKILRTLGQE